MTKVTVWVMVERDGWWEDCGEGPLTIRQAKRIASDLRGLVWATRILPIGCAPRDRVARPNDRRR